MAEQDKIENALSDDELDAVTGGRDLVAEGSLNLIDNKDSLKKYKDCLSAASEEGLRLSDEDRVKVTGLIVM